MIDIYCDITVNIPTKPLNFKILLDDVNVFNTITSESTYMFTHTLESDNQSHVLEFHVSGKTNEHTEIKDGVMVDSACIKLSNIKLNDVDVTSMALSNDDLITYTHDCNGHDIMKVNVFDSLLGFNGVVRLKFSTPLDEWVRINT